MEVACFMMQKNEGYLLMPWAHYHGHLFGPKNIYIFDNGSTAVDIEEKLVELEEKKFNVIRQYNKKEDFEQKGIVLGNFSKSLHLKYDFFYF